MCCKHFHYNNQMYTNFQLKKYRKLLLNSRYRDAHLQFAWEKWLKYAILWLSKQKGCLFVSDDILWVWYCSEIYKNCLISTVNHSNKNVMVYGCMSSDSTTDLHFISSIMNAEGYCNILKEMLPSLKHLRKSCVSA